VNDSVSEISNQPRSGQFGRCNESGGTSSNLGRSVGFSD